MTARRHRSTFGLTVSSPPRAAKLKRTARSFPWRATAVAGNRLLASLLLLTMVSLLAWFFLDTRFFVYAARVQGTAWIDADEVYRSSGLDSQSVFYIHRGQVAEQIRARVPAIEQVYVDCQLPNRVLIRVNEQDVRFIWRAGDSAFLVDGKGRVVQTDDGSHGELISIHDLDARPLKPGDQVDAGALRTVDQLHGLLPEARAFEYSQEKGVSLFDARGWRIYFGDDQALAEKMASMQAVMRKIASRGDPVKYIDLRFVGSPYYE